MIDRAALLFFALVSCSAFAQAPPPGLAGSLPREHSANVQATLVPVAGHELTATDLETFLDGFMPLQLLQNDIAGAVIAVVKDGKVLFTKGYGYADVETKRPMTPETLVRIGSTAKLFTWTSLMQQVEQGKVELDADVDRYLDYKIPKTFDKPILVRHLMTHTPGFEEDIKALGAVNVDLRRGMTHQIPGRIYPPGTTPAYSNYGAGMGGYIVQRVSGEPYVGYVESHVFKPLGMNHSTLVQPLPPEMASNMSSGYEVASSKAGGFEVVGIPPVGAATTTATDMTKFMLAYLGGGEYNGARILRPETVKVMFTRQPGLGLDSRGNLMCLGFYEASSHGHFMVGHEGDSEYFHALLRLMPDANLGFLVSYNSAGNGAIRPREVLWEKFLDRYFPANQPQEPTAATAAADVAAVAGTYMDSRRADDSFLKALYIAGETTVVPLADGAIAIDNDLFKDANGKPKHWREVGSLLYREVDGERYVIFQRDSSGRVTRFQSPWAVFVWQRVGLAVNKHLLIPLLVFSLFIMLSTVLAWPVAAVARKVLQCPLELPVQVRRRRLVIRLLCLLSLVFLAALGGYGAQILSDVFALTDGLDPIQYGIQLLGLIAALGTGVALYNAYLIIKDSAKGLWEKARAISIALAFLAFVWVVMVGHLANFNAAF